MRGVATSLDFIVRQNRVRAMSKTPIIQGGAAGAELAKEAGKQSADVRQGMMDLDGVLKPKFVLGLHPVDQTGRYVIP